MNIINNQTLDYKRYLNHEEGRINKTLQRKSNPALNSSDKIKMTARNNSGGHLSFKGFYSRMESKMSETLIGKGALAKQLAQKKWVKNMLQLFDKKTLMAEGLYALVITCGLRPIIHMSSPAKNDDEKAKNKYRAMYSISTGLLGFAFTLMVAEPLGKGIEKIMHNPSKYLKKTANQLSVRNGDAYKELAKRLHQPIFMPLRAILAFAIIPPLFKILGIRKTAQKPQEADPKMHALKSQNGQKPKVFKNFNGIEEKVDKNNTPSFKGLNKVSNEVASNTSKAAKKITAEIGENVINPARGILYKGYDKLTDGIANVVGKITDTNKFSELTKWLGSKDTFFPLVISAESIWMSTFYTLSAFRNKKVDKKQKTTEAAYQTLVTAFSTAGAFTVDALINKIMKNFGTTFKAANKELLKPEVLDSCLRGIGKLKTLIVFTTIYRFIGPVLLAPVANKLTSHLQQKAEAKKAQQNKTPQETSKAA